ncbi:hypothetical protein AB0L53_18720 [Nonomuraea sp. NPDC052129]|uniref:hypothetical protein n=1 Tax=Nonomuraea sp. NPDC052129 TaxID=3154651 RepID=UPI00341CDFE7
MGRPWFGRPLWEMESADADVYFEMAVRGTAKGTRLPRAQALRLWSRRTRSRSGKWRTAIRSPKRDLS